MCIEICPCDCTIKLIPLCRGIRSSRNALKGSNKFPCLMFGEDVD